MFFFGGGRTSRRKPKRSDEGATASGRGSGWRGAWAIMYEREETMGDVVDRKEQEQRRGVLG